MKFEKEKTLAGEVYGPMGPQLRAERAPAAQSVERPPGTIKPENAVVSFRSSFPARGIEPAVG